MQELAFSPQLCWTAFKEEVFESNENGVYPSQLPWASDRLISYSTRYPHELGPATARGTILYPSLGYLISFDNGNHTCHYERPSSTKLVLFSTISATKI